MDTDNKAKLWLKWEAWVIGISIASMLWFTTQFEAIRTNQALLGQKLDTLITWTEKHETETISLKQQLNNSFSYIYEKLGAKYTSQQ